MKPNKRCPKCRTTKDRSEFYSNKARSDGLNSWCRRCDNGACRERYASNPKYRAAIKKQGASWQKKQSRETLRGRQLRWRYGLTLDDWNALFEKQGRACLSCGDTDARRWHTDHCHTTGAVRGILCFGCNSALGYLRERATAAKGLLKYIEERCEPLRHTAAA